MIVSKRTSIVEGADYLLDMERTNPMKKKQTCSKLKAIVKDDKVDDGYTSFLDDLLELWDSKLVVEDEDDDPTYVMFLNNLREHGNAYMLDVSMEHGVFFPIKYEVEDESTDELKRKTTNSHRMKLIRESRSLNLDGAKTIGTLRSGSKRMGAPKENSNRHIRKRSSLYVDRELNSDLKRSCLEKENTQRHSHRFLEEEAQWKYRVRQPSQTVDCSPSEQNCSSYLRSVAVDEVYKVFLHGLKFVGQSFFYEDGAGKSERVYYEMSNQETSTDVDINLSETAPRTQCATPKPSTSPLRPQTSALRKPTPTPTPTPRQPTPKQSISALRKPTPTPRQPTPKLSTSPPIQQTPNPIAKNHHTVFNASDKMLKDHEKAFQSKHSSFWKELKSIVGKPYKQEDFEEYWHKVTDRRPVEVHKETRTGGYKSAPGHLGKSYLETHPDLECEIKKVKTDRTKVLNLLRGFFLYLQYVPHGVPRPWTSDVGKRIMLGSPEDSLPTLCRCA